MIVFLSSIRLIFVWNAIFPMLRSGNLLYSGKIFVVGESHLKNCNRDMLMHHIEILGGYFIFVSNKPILV